MVNLKKLLPVFGKTPAHNNEVLTQYANPKNYPAEVLEIHHEFEIASDKLISEAMNIINSKPKVNESKIERLTKFGFRQVKEVEQGTQILHETKMSKEQIDLVNYYKQNYPFNKFIIESQVMAICHKYNLVCGDVDRFRGFVPDANLKDLENFKLKEAESNVLTGIFYPYFNNSEPVNVILENAEIILRNNYYHIYKKGDTSKNPKHAFQQGIEKGNSDFYAGDDYNLFGLRYLGGGKLFIESTKLKICAPVKDMDISGLELKEGYKLQRKIEIPDPVVLQQVKGGYLIVTAWGDEASDPMVVNENFN